MVIGVRIAPELYNKIYDLGKKDGLRFGLMAAKLLIEAVEARENEIS